MQQSGLSRPWPENSAYDGNPAWRTDDDLGASPAGIVDHGDVDARPWCCGFHAAMQPRLLAWAPLLDLSNTNHGLLLPSCCTASMITAVRCSDRPGMAARPRNSCAIPSPISRRSSRPCVNIGCRSATPESADYSQRGTSCRLRLSDDGTSHLLAHQRIALVDTALQPT